MKQSFRWMGAVLTAVVAGAVLLVGVRAMVKTAAALTGRGIPTLSVEGSIMAVNLKPLRPTLILTERGGQLLKLQIEPEATLDPNATLVSENGKVVPVDQLEKGQRVRVRYQMKKGEGVAKYIEILTPQPMPDFPSTQPLPNLPPSSGETDGA